MTRPNPATRLEEDHSEGRILVVLPARNEAASVGAVVKEVRDAVPMAAVVVVDDGSSDDTAVLAREAGARVISNPFSLGVGAAMRVGFRYADARGYSVVVQVDADGQHDPRDVPGLLAALDRDGPPHVVIGARFSSLKAGEVLWARRLAMRLLAWYLSKITGTRLTDVTSGFRVHNVAAVRLFARLYPPDYLADTVESLIICIHNHGRVGEVPVAMRPRFGGSPSQSGLSALVYLVRVMLMLAMNVIRPRPRPKEILEAI